MSRSNPVNSYRLPRRRHLQPIDKSEVNSSSKDLFDPHHYTELILDRMHQAWITAEPTESVIGRQMRHVNNHQHSISFRQQFIEQITKDIEEIDRRIAADYRKHQEQEDKFRAVMLRKLEETYQRKSRDLALYNNQRLVEEILRDHLKKRTSEGQQQRIEQLEQESNRMKYIYDELLERVERNELQHDEDKREHDRQMNKAMQNVEHYRKEMEDYKKIFKEKIIQLNSELKTLRRDQDRLEKQQNEHGAAITALPSLQETIRQLSEQMKQLAKQYENDAAEINKLAQVQIVLKNGLDQFKIQIIPIERIPSIEREIQRICSLLIGPKPIDTLEHPQHKIHDNLVWYDELLRQFNNGMVQLGDLYEQLHKKIDSIQIPDLSTIHSRLNNLDGTVSEHDRNMKSLQTNVSSLASRLPELDNALKEMQPNIDGLEKNFVDLKNQVDDLLKTKFDPTAFQDQLNQLIRSMHQLLNDIRQTIANSINDTRNSIEMLKKLVSELLNKREDPPKAPVIVEKQSKRAFVKEPLQPRDLFDDIWTKY